MSLAVPPLRPAGSSIAERLWRLSLRRPRAVLGFVAALVSVAGLTATGLRLEASIDLLSDDDPVMQRDRARVEAFGPDLRLLVALYRANDAEDLNDPEERTLGGVLRAPSLEALRELHAGLEAIDGVRTVSSLANAPVLVEPPTGLWGAPPPDPAVPAAVVGEPLLVDELVGRPITLRQRLDASKPQRLLLLTPRESLTPLYLELEPGAPEASIVERVVALARDVEERYPDGCEILVVGPALVETSLAGHVFDDLSGLVPFSIALIAVGLLLLLRRWVFLATALAHAVALEALVLGGMAALGWSVNLVSVLAPVILVPVGVADLLHLFVRLEAGSGTDDAPGALLDRLADAFRALQAPMLATTATTALGFLGFLLSPVAAIRQFGVTLAVGAVVALLLTFTLDAALLVLAWRPRERPEQAEAGWPTRALLAMRAPRTLRATTLGSLVLVGAVAVVSGLALPRLTIEDTWIRNFDPGSRVLRDTRVFEGEMSGTNTLSLVVTADPAVDGSRQRALDVVERLTSTHAVTSGTRGVLSATLLERALEGGWPWRSRDAPTPEAMRDAAETWRRRGMPLPSIDRFADDDLRTFQVQILVLNQPFADLEAVLERIVPAARHAAGPGVRVEASGNLAVNVRMVRQAVSGQGVALGLLLVTVTAALVLLARSLTVGLALALPMLLAIGLSFVAVVELGWPYGIALSMCPTLVVGLSVDFALHLRAVLVRHRGSPAAVWARELRTVLRGIAWNGLLWSSGFALLAASSLPPNRLLGLLSALVVASSTVLTFALLPLVQSAIARALGRRREG